MNKFIVILSMLVSSVVFAMPTVGDFIEYDRQTIQGDRTISETVTQEIISYNTITKKFREKTSVRLVDGRIQTSERENSLEVLMDDKELGDILSRCRSYGGKTVNLPTPAGNISTCALPMNDIMNQRTIWYGKIPFGVVKDEVTLELTGDRQVLMLKSFRPGK
ncbi:MAG: hypothetical protein SGI74_07130 [Oligoflexia bacterium]|nr:hypothetical protein [Oligoflexia bacterium]